MLRLMEKNAFDHPAKGVWEHMLTLEKLQLVKEMVTELVVY